MTKKVLVTFDDDEWKMISKNTKSGRGDADVVRTIVLDSLKRDDDVITQIATHEIMIATLVHELSSKGLINFDDWEQKVKNQIE